jgi:monofunctional biosynthetic peptidoglycan transglycosylase
MLADQATGEGKAVTGWRRLRWLLVRVAVGFVALSIVLVVVYRFLPPPVTPLMVVRLFDGEGLAKDWASYDDISPNLFKAVIAAEDARFCQHVGFDFGAIRDAWRKNQSGRRLYGGSTISMQTAKNAFLWPGRDYVRKAFEAYFTALIELFWDKRRILEVYVNIVEFGHGIYGVEAAAQAHFKKSARDLSPREAALLAAVLPNPRRWSAGHPSSFVARRAATIMARMRDLPAPGDAHCPVGRFAD